MDIHAKHNRKADRLYSDLVPVGFRDTRSAGVDIRYEVTAGTPGHCHADKPATNLISGFNTMISGSNGKMPAINIVTPSYWADFHLTKKLSESIDKYCDFEFIHYIIVSKCDLKIFSGLSGPNRQIICAEHVLSRYGFRKIPLPRRIRVPFLGEKRYREQWYRQGVGRVGGWTVQQIIKLATADFCTANTLVFADSDIEIIRPIAAERFIENGKVLLHEHGNIAANPRSAGWRHFALELFNLPESADRRQSNVGNLIAWDRQTLIEMRDQIDRQHGSWSKYLAIKQDISEYTIYGTYVYHIKNSVDHIIADQNLYCSIWDEAGLDQEITLNDSHVAIHLQSMLPIATDRREAIIHRLKNMNDADAERGSE